MIVKSMTVKEIHDEFLEDVKSLKNKVDEYRKVFRKMVLRGSRYPMTRSFDFMTREKKNKFVIGFTALKRSDSEKPILYFYGTYSRSEGKYAVALSLDMDEISIYPPHFFMRYRERIVKDELISNDELIRQYFRNDWGFMGATVNKDYESVFHCFENEDENEKLSFVAATTQGFCFGEKQGAVNIVKTIITESMLFENQRPLFSDLSQQFNQANNSRYNNDK